jgi:hypothetical protein
VLPLSSSVKRIAVVGPLADQTAVLLGNRSGTPTRTADYLVGIRTSGFASVTLGAGDRYRPGDRRADHAAAEIRRTLDALARSPTMNYGAPAVPPG